MRAALDVCYREDAAVAACVVFERWSDDRPADVVRTTMAAAPRYRPGRFFERELPCLLKVLSAAGREFETILVDGYVHLKRGDGRGLGARLYDALPYPTAVIGVAKSPLAVADRFVPILRGRSTRPLYVSAVGWPLAQAAARVARMHGPHRIPTLLRLADQRAREP